MKRFLVAALAIAGMVGLIPSQSHAINLVMNGSFETPDITGDSSGGTHWSKVPEGDAFGSSAGWEAAEDDTIEFWEAPMYSMSAADGDQWVELAGDLPDAIFQVFDTTPGTRYDLSFAVAARPDAAFNELVMFVGPILPGDFDEVDGGSPSVDPFMENFEPTGDGWTYYHRSFQAFTQHTGIAFGDARLMGDAQSYDQGSYGILLDDVRVDVSPVPEPGTMVLLGTGLIGLAGRARKKFKG